MKINRIHYVCTYNPIFTSIIFIVSICISMVTSGIDKYKTHLINATEM